MTGNGIASITKTGTDGLVDTYTITYTNGNTTTFTITNGEDGEVTETELNVLRQKVADQQKVIDQLPQVTGQGTEVTLENTIEAPFTKFDVEGNSVQDGSPSPDNEQPIYSAGDNGSINEKIKNADGTEEQNYSIFVQQPFRSIGNVRDCFVKKSDGWYERHYIGRKIFDGTEDWLQSSQSSQRFILGAFNNALTNSSQVLVMSEKYRGIKFDDLNSDINYTCYSQQGWFGFNTKNIVSLSEWKEKLLNDNLSFYYVLAEPLDLPCTETQIQQLENKPSTYKDFTIIQSQDETPAYLEVSGIYDLNNLINN